MTALEPITLFSEYEPIDGDFSGYGLGELYDVISAEVTEERNGIYELYVVRPIDADRGRTFTEHLSVGQILAVTVAPTNRAQRRQPFRIYRIERNMDGEAQIYAAHVSYLVNSVVTIGDPEFDITDAADAMAAIKTGMRPNNALTFGTDVETSGAFAVDVPKSVRSALMGEEGSVLDVFGGEYEYDRSNVFLHASRGADRGASVRYGKNLTGLDETTDADSILSGVAPFWKNDETGAVVKLPEVVIWYEDIYPDEPTRYPVSPVVAIDMSADFESEPTVAQLRTAAQAYIVRNARLAPSTGIEAEFVPLDRLDTGIITEAIPDDIRLCDTVTVEHEGMGIRYQAKVVQTVWDCLRARYVSITVGTTQQELSDTIAGLEAAEDGGEKRYLPISGGTVYGALSVTGAISEGGKTLSQTYAPINTPDYKWLPANSTATFTFSDAGVLFVSYGSNNAVYVFDRLTARSTPTAGSVASTLKVTHSARTSTVTIQNTGSSGVTLLGLHGTFS